MSFTAYLKDTSGTDIYQLKDGSNILGRNYPKKTNNNKISRKHTEINFSKESGVLTIVPLSENPVGIISKTSNANDEGHMLKIKKGNPPQFIRFNENVNFFVSLLPGDPSTVYEIVIQTNDIELTLTQEECEPTQIDHSQMDIDITIAGDPTLSKKRTRDEDDDFDSNYQRKLFKRTNSTPRIDPSTLKIISKISAGSCGEVFKATWLGTNVAVKRIFRSLLHDQALDEFEAETNILKRVRHPNIVLFLGISTSPGNGSSGEELCLVTEYMSRGSLFHVLMDPNVKLDTYKMINIACDAAKGMNYLHKHNPPIIHRDLKSQNLLVDDFLNVKVTDFGLAKYLNSSDDNNNTFCGTLPWTAPEIFNAQGYTVKADVYSFGIVLWEIMTRSVVYKGLSKPDIIMGVTKGTLRPPIPPYCHPDISKLMCECWDQNPDNRPTFEEIVQRLEEIRQAEKANRKSEFEIDISEISNGVLVNRDGLTEIVEAEFRGQKVKVTIFNVKIDPKLKEKMVEEYKTLMDVKSPCITMFYGFSLTPNVVIVTEYLKNYQNLKEIMMSPVTFNWEISLKISMEIAKAIKILHSWKPAILIKNLMSQNISINENYDVKINGMEVSRFYGNEGENLIGRNDEDSIYLSPEVGKGMKYSKSSDIYSFSIILWEIVHKCILGKYVRPYGNHQPGAELYRKIFEENLRPTISDLCPTSVINLIESCWNPNVEERYNCDDIISHLQSLLSSMS